MKRTQPQFDLLDAFLKPGCPVCRLTLAAIDRRMDAMNYESVGDAEFRAELREANGFCNLHAHQWLARAHVLGTAQIYQDILACLTQELQSAQMESASMLASWLPALGSPANHGAVARLRPNHDCPACSAKSRRESELLEHLLSGLPDALFRARYFESAGLCLPHLASALERVATEEQFATLRDFAVANQERLIADLARLVQRHDYRFMKEPWGAERDAPARAVAYVAGASGIGEKRAWN